MKERNHFKNQGTDGIKNLKTWLWSPSPPNSSNLAPSLFSLILRMILQLGGRSFRNVPKIQVNSLAILHIIKKS
jgi:hypothetical protein